MPLSEEELRMLEQMERALVEEDPKLASTMRGTTLRKAARRRAILAGAVFLVGVAVLMGGAVSGYTVVGILGFAVMLGSATLAVTALRSRHATSSEGEAPTAGDGDTAFTLIEGGRSKGRSQRSRRPRGGSGSSGSFMERMEERWKRRRDNGFG